MPYVTVFFDPVKISQDTIDKLKLWLQPEVARVLSMRTLVVDNAPLKEIDEDHPFNEIVVFPDEIMVVQHAFHATDVNIPPLEIYIQAGRPKFRDSDKIVVTLGQLISDAGIIPDEHLGHGLSGIFINFHPDNGFGFIPRRI